jgi:hypothetical protein
MCESHLSTRDWTIRRTPNGENPAVVKGEDWHIKDN